MTCHDEPLGATDSCILHAGTLHALVGKWVGALLEPSFWRRTKKVLAKSHRYGRI